MASITSTKSVAPNMLDKDSGNDGIPSKHAGLDVQCENTPIQYAGLDIQYKDCDPIGRVDGTDTIELRSGYTRSVDEFVDSQAKNIAPAVALYIRAGVLSVDSFIKTLQHFDLTIKQMTPEKASNQVEQAMYGRLSWAEKGLLFYTKAKEWF